MTRNPLTERMRRMGFSAVDIKVKRVFRLNEGNADKPLKAFVSIVFNDALLVTGFKVFDGKKGLWVSMPKEQSPKDKKWYESVRCLKEEVRWQIEQAILEAYSDEKPSELN